MIGATFCSGIGAPEMAAAWVDWRLASEIEPFPRAVLQERFGYRAPEDHNQGDPLLWGDMTEITPDLMRERGIPLPDLIVAGTPCQDFSVAGLRAGLKGDRGNLTLTFVELLHAIVAARPDGKLAVLWENVPGVLSDKGNAFGCFLGGVVGAVDALQPPGDGSWPGEGMVQGPRARAAWAVLDAQWFGVAQRRRRVFVVIDFGGAVDPAAVLLEPDRLRGDSAPRREAGQRPSPTLAARTNGGGGFGTDFDCDGGLIANETAHCLQTTCDDYSRADGFNMVAHSLTAGMAKSASRVPQEQGALIPVAFDCKGTEVQSDVSGGETPLRSMGHLNSHQNAGGHAAVAFDTTQITSPENVSNPRPGDPCHPLAAGAHPPALADPWAVRRLTPTECHRLQGFPDDHCAVTNRKKPAADGPQYKALGNSMAVPCVAWILDRIKISHEQMRRAA